LEWLRYRLRPRRRRRRLDEPQSARPLLSVPPRAAQRGRPEIAVRGTVAQDLRRHLRGDGVLGQAKLAPSHDRQAAPAVPADLKTGILPRPPRTKPGSGRTPGDATGSPFRPLDHPRRQSRKLRIATECSRIRENSGAAVVAGPTNHPPKSPEFGYAQLRSRRAGTARPGRCRRWRRGGPRASGSASSPCRTPCVRAAAPRPQQGNGPDRQYARHAEPGNVVKDVGPGNTSTRRKQACPQPARLRFVVVFPGVFPSQIASCVCEPQLREAAAGRLR